MEKKVTLGYWGMRGRAQISRLLLAYTGAVWQDKKYTAMEQWFGADKQSLSLPLPNLPYLIEQDFKLTESRAIQYYIIQRSNKTDLLGKNTKDRAMVMNLVNWLADINVLYIDLIQNKQKKGKEYQIFNEQKLKFSSLAKFYDGKPFALGYLTLVDFMMAQSSYYAANIFPQEYKTSLKFMDKVRQNFETIPEIKKYYQQQTAVKGPFIPPCQANFSF